MKIPMGKYKGEYVNYSRMIICDGCIPRFFETGLRTSRQNTRNVYLPTLLWRLQERSPLKSDGTSCDTVNGQSVYTFIKQLPL
jgi:hypothetical protein